MPGGYDKHQRFDSETATPEGEVHYEHSPIPVRFTSVSLQPRLEVQYDAWVLAWTRNAVLVLWVQTRTGGKELQTRWVPPNRVTRLAPEDHG